MKTGRIMFEIKGETNAKVLTSGYDVIETSAKDKILETICKSAHSERWATHRFIFAEEEAAREVRDLFDAIDQGRVTIRGCTYLSEEQSLVTTQPNYTYSLRSKWPGRVEAKAAIGAKFVNLCLTL